MKSAGILCGWLTALLPFAAGATPFPSTYKPLPSEPTVIVGANLMVGDGTEIIRGYVTFRAGRITEVSAGDPADTAGLTVIDASGKWVTPGIIDVHSHLGVYASPGYSPHSDGNERTSPNTAEVWAEHSVWPQDPQFPLALAGGVTTLQVLPGSANLFGGRSVVLKNVPSRTMQGMKFPDAPYGLKMACGENPKRVYGNKGKMPSTRMGNVAEYRGEWIKAQKYRDKWRAYEQAQADGEGAEGGKSAKDEKDGKDEKEPPTRDLRLETMMGVLEGEILVHNHCYRADEMAVMLDIAEEFGYAITAFHHAVESYKIADMLAARDVCSAMWADWGRFKLEAFDAIKENVALVEAAGACAIVHSDSKWDIQRLNQEAAKALAAGRRMGLEITDAEAIRWITLNAAKALGLEDRIGSLAPGKAADIVIWNQSPLSVYSRSDTVFIDGAMMYDRASGLVPVTDFELGQREAVQ